MFRQTFLPVVFLISGKLTAWHFNSLLIPGGYSRGFLAFVRYQQNHYQKVFNWETTFVQGGLAF